jgi:hypothetical protein
MVKIGVGRQGWPRLEIATPSPPRRVRSELARPGPLVSMTCGGAGDSRGGIAEPTVHHLLAGSGPPIQRVAAGEGEGCRGPWRPREPEAGCRAQTLNTGTLLPVGQPGRFD